MGIFTGIYGAGRGGRVARFAAVLGVVALSACAPIVEHHGFAPSQRDLAGLTPGVSTRAQVREVLPPPTTTGPTGAGDMYYVYSRFETTGPLPRREVDRQIVALNFSGDRLTGIARYGLQDGIAVPLTLRATNDNVTNMSFVRQLMGSVGRFDPSQILSR